MPTETEYRRICRRECEWCAKGVVMGPDGSHVDDTGYANWRLGRVCTAPTPIQVIERLTAELAAANNRIEVAQSDAMNYQAQIAQQNEALEARTAAIPG